MEQRLVQISEAARRIGVSVQTIRRWADAGKIPSLRTPSGRRVFTEEQIAAIRRQMGLPDEEPRHEREDE
jgi:excisionase family DNA binding protein